MERHDAGEPDPIDGGTDIVADDVSAGAAGSAKILVFGLATLAVALTAAFYVAGGDGDQQGSAQPSSSRTALKPPANQAGVTLSATARADRQSQFGDVCPGLGKVIGQVHAQGGRAGVRYRWALSDGQATTPTTVEVAAGKSVTVEQIWRLNTTRFSGQTWLEILGPTVQRSEKVDLDVTCWAEVTVNLPDRVNDSVCRVSPIRVRATVSVNSGPQQVSYQWRDGIHPITQQQVDFTEAGTKEITYVWPGGDEPDRGIELNLAITAPTSFIAGVVRVPGPCPSPSAPPA